jgi:carbamoyl-phosphate synthase large subunit
MVNKVTEGRPHIVDMIKNNEISAGHQHRRRDVATAITDSRQIRHVLVAGNRVTTFTSIAGCGGRRRGHEVHGQLDVISVQEMHAQLNGLTFRFTA